MNFINILLLLFVFIIDYGFGGYIQMSCWNSPTNGWDGGQHLNYAYEWLAGQYSYHSNHREDRIYRWRYCRPTHDIWSQYGGDIGMGWTAYDSHWKKQCSGYRALKFIQSHHSNNKEDRQFYFKCRAVNPKYQLWNCGWTGYVNNWDSTINYNCPHNGILRGVESYHHNHYEDRRWRHVKFIYHFL